MSRRSLAGAVSEKVTRLDLTVLLSARAADPIWDAAGTRDGAALLRALAKTRDCQVESLSMSTWPPEFPEPAPKPTAWVIKRTLGSGSVHYLGDDGRWGSRLRARRFRALGHARAYLKLSLTCDSRTDRVVRLKPRGAQ